MSNHLRHCVLLAAFCTASLFYAPIFAADGDKKVLRFGFKSSFPMSYMENGKAVGQLIDVAHSALAATGRPFESRAYPLRRMLRLLAEGDLDVGINISTSTSPQGTALIGTSSLVILRLQLYCICPKAPASIWDLSNETLGIVANYTFAGIVDEVKIKRPGVRLTPAASQLQAIQLLRAKRVDYILTYERDTTFIFSQLKMPLINKTTVKEMPLVFMVSKKTQNPADLLAKLEKAARAYKKSVRSGKTLRPSENP